MAPSANRRSGFSRRAQYSTFFSYAAGVLGALAGAALLLVSLFDPHAFSSLKGLAADAAAPGGEAAAAGRNASRGLFSGIGDYFRAGSQNAELRRELRVARSRLIEADATRAENQRLRKLLGIASADPRPVAAAAITASTATSTRRHATIGAGSNQGVAVGMPVRSADGVLGRVLDVSGSTARVLLVTDTESVVPVRRARDGIAAFAQGNGDGTLSLRLINLGINPLRKGDIFVTSGSGGLYRPGSPIAVVTRLTADGATARVLADPAATEYAIVDPAWAAAAPESQATAPAAGLPGQ